MSAYELRISDWSSDVCSSDLHRADLRPPHRRRQGRGAVPGRHQEPARESAPDAARDVTPSSIPALGIRDWGFANSRYPALPLPPPQSHIPFFANEMSSPFYFILIFAGPPCYHPPLPPPSLFLPLPFLHPPPSLLLPPPLSFLS